MIHCGDCLDVMRGMEPNSVDAIVTDPPYGLEFMGKEWDKLTRNLMNPTSEADKKRKEAYKFNYAGRRSNLPDYSALDKAGMQDWHYAWAVEALRVAKPGCHLLAFGGTRTFHRLACAIEDAGWEIRDTLGWIYGSGFPKSESVSLAIDKKACRVELEARLGRKPTRDEMRAAWEGYRIAVGEKKLWGHNAGSGMGSFSKNQYEGQTGIQRFEPITASATDAAKQWEGWGTALKPAWEPIILARKPLDGTVAANVLKWGTGSINIDGCRVEIAKGDYKGLGGGGVHGVGDKIHNNVFGEYAARINIDHSQGRWPANLIHDGSEEVLELFPDNAPSGGGNKRPIKVSTFNASPKHGRYTGGLNIGGDSGSAARFFYCAKASRAEREAGCEGMEEHDSNYREEYRPMAIDSGDKGQDTPYAGVNRSGGVRNHHPTVKPLALMRYLVRLVTPPNGTILDPFMGSGTTGMAAKQEGFEFIGIEKEKEYVDIAERRIEATA